jgi:hypothetical protein
MVRRVRRRSAVVLAAAALVLAPVVVPAGGATAAASAATGPRAVVLRAGAMTGDTGTLGRRDGFGSGDSPGGYLVLDPQGGRYAARFAFAAPRAAVDLLLALRAPDLAQGRWRVEVRTGGEWVRLWNNGDGSGAWWGGSLPLAVEEGERVVVRVVGRGAALFLDRLALAGAPWRPAPGTTWQWQLSGTIDTSRDVAMYDVDLFDTPSAVIDRLHREGRVVVCYFSAGSWEDWRPDRAAFPAVLKGRALEGWPGERWLDVRRLDLLGEIMEARLDLAVARGCDGVEPDNVDGYENGTGFPLTASDQQRYNTWLAERAHERGLSVGLKNDLGQVAALVGLFDWALNEQCFEYDECPALFPFVAAGKAVFGVEYRGDPGSFCPQALEWGFSWLRKRLALGAWAIPCGS